MVLEHCLKRWRRSVEPRALSFKDSIACSCLDDFEVWNYTTHNICLLIVNAIRKSLINIITNADIT